MLLKILEIINLLGNFLNLVNQKNRDKNKEHITCKCNELVVKLEQLVNEIIKNKKI